MRFLRILKLNKIKRIIIFSLTTIIAILAIILGSIFYNKPNTQLNSNYYTSSQYMFKITNFPSDVNKNDFVQKVAQDIKNRLDVDLSKDVEVNSEITSENELLVRATYPGIDTIEKQTEISKFIEKKPNLVLLDYYGNALFDQDGQFNDKLSGDPGNWIRNPEDVDWDIESKIPMANEGADFIYSDKPNLSIELRNQNARTEWYKATEYVYNLPEEKRVVVAFLYLNEYIQIAKTHERAWEDSKQNPYFFSFVNNRPTDANKNPNILKKRQLNAANYLISDYVFSPTGITPKTGALSGDLFFLKRPVISSVSEIKQVVNQINYGSSNYQIETLSSYFIPPTFGYNSFNWFLISGIIIFVLSCLFLILNYGIMGVIGSISLALFAFLSWTLFILLGGVFSPIIVGAIIFMLGFFLNKNITFFEKIKHDLSRGDSLSKTLKISSKKITSILFDNNVVGIILVLGLFYFGSQMIWGFSLFLMIGFIVSLFVSLLFTKGLTLVFLNTGIFNEKKQWLGLNSKKQYKKSLTSQLKNNFNFVAKCPIFTYSFLIIISLAIIMITIFGAINFSWLSTFNFSVSLRGGSIFQINNITQQNQWDGILTIFQKNGIYISQQIFAQDSSLPTIIIGKIDANLDLNLIKEQLDVLGVKTYAAIILGGIGKTLVISALVSLVISMLFIFVYIIFRFKWVFALTILTMSIFDLIILISLFAIFRLPINNEFIIGSILVVIYGFTNHIFNFSKIKEKSSIHLGELTKKVNIDIANQSVKINFKQLLISSSILITLMIILLIFSNIINLSLLIAIIFGVVISFISTIFIGPNLWVNLEKTRQKYIEKRVKNEFWNVNNPEEQTFNGINNFKV